MHLIIMFVPSEVTKDGALHTQNDFSVGGTSAFTGAFSWHVSLCRCAYATRQLKERLIIGKLLISKILQIHYSSV